MDAFVASIAVSTAHWKNHTSLVISFAGCNFKCPWCFVQTQLEFKPEFLVPLREIKKKIADNLSFIDSILFTGGEPTLQRQALVSLGHTARSLGLQIGIVTNGTKPDVLKSLLLEGLLDFIALDIKSPFEPLLFEEITKSKTYFVKTDEYMNSIHDSIQVLKLHPVDKEIRTTIIPTFLDSKKNIESIALLLNGLHAEWVLQRYIPSSKKDIFLKPADLTISNLSQLRDFASTCLPTAIVSIKED